MGGHLGAYLFTSTIGIAFLGCWLVVARLNAVRRLREYVRTRFPALDMLDPPLPQEAVRGRRQLGLRWRLVGVFLVYLVVLIWFGGLYQSIYEDDATSFLFSADIKESQSQHFLAQADQTLRSLRGQRANLDELVGIMAAWKGDPLKCGDSGCFEYRSPARSFRFRQPTLPPDVQDPNWVLECKSRSGELVGRWVLRPARPGDIPVRSATLEDLTTGIISSLDHSIAQASRDVQGGPDVLPKMRSYWDFLYFSGITLTTVGYGDILPNRTLVRVLVLTEILVGIFLFVFVVSFVVSTGQKVATDRQD